MAGNAPRKKEPAKAKVDEAVALEAALAQEAAEVRGDATALTSDLFLKLWPLACRPIPPGFILEVSRGDGKPYDSRGIRSVQVQIARMDAVFTPLAWDYQTTWLDEGKVAEVTVTVHVGDRDVKRTARGGMDRGSTRGNVMKGSETNAAKMAFARLGVGGHVYIGATDHDPDVDPEAAKQQAAPTVTANASPDVGKPIGAKKATEIVDAAWMLGLQDTLQLAASHVVGDDVGDCSSKTVATKALTDLTQMQAAKVESWLSRKADETAASENGAAS